MKRYLRWALALLTLAAMTLGAAAEGLEVLYEAPGETALEASSSAVVLEAQAEDVDPVSGETELTLGDGEDAAPSEDGTDAPALEIEPEAVASTLDTLPGATQDGGTDLIPEGEPSTEQGGETPAGAPDVSQDGETPEGAPDGEDKPEGEPDAAQEGENQPEGAPDGEDKPEGKPDAAQEGENQPEGEPDEAKDGENQPEGAPDAEQEGGPDGTQDREKPEGAPDEAKDGEKPEGAPEDAQAGEASETASDEASAAAAGGAGSDAPAQSAASAPAAGAQAPAADAVAEAQMPAETAAKQAAEAAPANIVLGVRETYAIPGMEGATFTSANRKVATVTAAGVVRGKKTGRTKVVAVRGAERVEYPVRVKKAPKKISFSKKKLTLSYDGTQHVGEQRKLSPKLSKGSSSRIAYVGYDPKVVNVSPEGVVTAVGVGTTRVTARTYNKKKAKITVTVTLAPGTGGSDAPVPFAASLAMGKGERSAPLLGGADVNAVCGGVTFKSTNKKVATVNAQGVVKARKQGKATIRIRGANGTRANVKIRVYKAPRKVTLSAKKLSMDQYTTAKLTAKLPKGQAGAVTFTSSNEGIAQVDAGGTVSAVGVGSAVITARTYNGKKAKCTVTVGPLALEIHMADVARCSTGRTTVFPIEVVNKAGQVFTGPVSVTIEPADVATYENGKIQGRRGGQTAQLTVKASETTRSCAVIVEDSANAREVMAIAHRGSIHWPENSLEAFRYFATTGADAVELDVRSTSDGVQVVLHDASFYSNGVQLNVVNQTYETIKALFPNACTLDEALDEIAKSDRDIFINTKETADGAKCARAVRARGLQNRTVYFCATDQIFTQIYGVDTAAKLGYSLGSGAVPTGPELDQKIKSLHASYIMLQKTHATQEIVEYWHARKYKVCVWTVNDKDAMRALCDMGVEGIVTDYPEYCVEARARG